MSNVSAAIHDPEQASISQLEGSVSINIGTSAAIFFKDMQQLAYWTQTIADKADALMAEQESKS